MLHRPVLLLTMMLLNVATACTAAQRVVKIVGPDGSDDLLVSCYSMNNCYSDAREACGGPYQIISTTSQVATTLGQVDTKTTLLVKCANEAARASN